MQKLIKIWQKHREGLMYLFFGGLTTLVNIGLFMLLSTFTHLSTGAANAIALVASILFAYVTNKLWVFESKLTGVSALLELGKFLACRALTALLDQAIVVLGVDYLGALLSLADSWLWAAFIKLLANILVILLNYLLSKRLIFAD